jgi:uncharacterized zinc-type alcohol dehydrogenase-like protein
VNGFNLIFGNRILAGSAIGGLRETQEMLDFCAEKNVMPEIEVIGADEINEAWDRLLKGDVRYRFVIDMGTIGQA